MPNDNVPQWSKVGIPTAAPEPTMAFVPPGQAKLLYYKFPEVPGVPAVTLSVARRYVAVGEPTRGERGKMAEEPWFASLTSISGQLERVNYHWARFWDHVQIARARREVVGGPVVSDPSVTRAILCESAAMLAASRAVVDLVLRTSQLRAGLKVKKASFLVLEDVPPEYLIPEIEATRHLSLWYDEMNAYRNVMEHRGWQENGYGLFEKSDTAPEARSTFHNVCLLPDRASLRGERLPHEWTYAEGKWLLDLISQTYNGLIQLSEKVADAWSLPMVSEGKIPRAEQPDVFVTVPLGTRLSGDKESRLLLFGSKSAWQRFCDLMKEQGWQCRGDLMSVRPLVNPDGKRIILLAYDPSLLDDMASIQIVSCSQNGKLNFTLAHEFRPKDRNGPIENTVALELRHGSARMIYTVVPTM